MPAPDSLPPGPGPSGPAGASPPAAKPPGLGPHCVGQRVVVRRVVPGETGPTGGPAFTDLLGTMLVWEPPVTVVEAESGQRVTIALADIVSGKPVPPRPSPRLRVSVAEAEHRAIRGWPPVDRVDLGEWVLRAAGGFSARANSVLALGDPGVPLDEALATVRAFYEARTLPVWAQVVVGSDLEATLVARGWVTARPGEADTTFYLASVAQVARALRRAGASARSEPADPALAHAGNPSSRREWSGAWSVGTAPTDVWLASDDRARAHPAAAHAVLAGPPEVAFVSTGSPAVAKGRISLADDWAGITDVWVSPDHRRQGLAVGVMAELIGWAAERGATTAYLQARDDNAAALGLYDRLGFVAHHTYRYVRPPD